ncbi:MAG: hypothetical protein Q9173_003877 [Seirophora scorigena]
MSASRSLTSSPDPTSAEDPMDFYPDQGNHLSAGDGIDIDLDFSTEPPQDIDDDEMIEQPEIGVGQTEYLDSDPEHDERMADETGVDDRILLDAGEDAFHGPDEDLDDFSGEPHDGPAMSPASEDLSLLCQSRNDTISQNRTQQTAQNADSLTHSGKEPNASGAHGGTQETAGQRQIDRQPLFQGSSLPYTDGPPTREMSPEEETCGDQSPATKLNQDTKSLLDEQTFRRQSLQGAVGDSQVVGPDDPLRPIQFDVFPADSPNAVSESTGRPEWLTANAYSACGNDAMPSGDDGSSQFISSEGTARPEEFSTSDAIAQADETLSRNSDFHDINQDLDSDISTEKNHSQHVENYKESPYIHAVLITYQESEMFLFPPAAEDQDNNQTYFLTDETLASESIQFLLRECRHVLEGSISEGEELESTADASTISLTRILDVFLQLHYHDGDEEPPPMKMTLSTRFRFLRRFEYLTDLVAEGKGISQLEYEDLSVNSGSSEDFQGTSKATEEPAADLYATEPNQVPAQGDDGQQELHTEDSTAQVFTPGTQHSVNPSIRGERQLNMIYMAAIPPGVTPSSTDDTHRANDQTTSITNSPSTVPVQEPHGTEDLPEDLSSEVEGYEANINYQEDNDNNRNSSNGSSTIQGDDAATTDGKVAIWGRAATCDINLTPAEQLPTGTLGEGASTEDLITYEDDEEDDEEDEIGSVRDSSLQTTERPRMVPADVPASTYVDPVDAAKVLPRYAIQNDEDASNNLLGEDLKASTVDQDDADSRGFSLDEPGDGSRSGPDSTKNRTWQSGDCVPNDQASIVNDLGLPGAYQKLDQNDVFKSDAAAAASQRSVLSADDEDEINYNDEIIDEAETEDLAEAATDVALDQPLPLSSSPGALKRQRATDDDIALSATDTKRDRVPDRVPDSIRSIKRAVKTMVDEKYIGLALAIVSTMAIGTSFVITKKGLLEASERHGFEGDGFAYLKSPTWWGGIVTMVVGEVANFAAYAYAPAILVTPLGALSVLIGAVLGAYFLKEELGTLGKLGCAMCLIGSVIIVLHAPPDKDITTVDEILHLAIHPGFLLYCAAVAVFASVMIYRVAPQHGRKNPLIYISICSTVGSISVMSVKAFGIALKLSLGGTNQFTYPSTYIFIIVTIVCILTQMNYFNKALSQFSTSLVNPLYYVTFTTATLCASFILFRGFNTTDAVNTISLLSGFLVIFTGVYLLNLSREDPNGRKLLNGKTADGVPTDGITGLQTRASMQTRRSIDAHRISSGSAGFGTRGDREGLIHSYDEENGGFGLTDLTEDSEEEHETPRPSVNGRVHQSQRYSKIQDQ